MHPLVQTPQMAHLRRDQGSFVLPPSTTGLVNPQHALTPQHPFTPDRQQQSRGISCIGSGGQLPSPDATVSSTPSASGFQSPRPVLQTTQSPVVGQSVRLSVASSSRERPASPVHSRGGSSPSVPRQTHDVRDKPRPIGPHVASVSGQSMRFESTAANPLPRRGSF